LPAGHPLETTTSLDYVVDAFLKAPNSQVHNPDGTDGVNMHIQLDEKDIPDEGWTGDLNGDGKINTSDVLKHLYMLKNGQPADNGQAAVIGRFGTPDERKAANAKQLLNAKKLAYRYFVFADYFFDTLKKDGTFTFQTSGVTELGGNDGVITLGQWDVPVG